MSRCLPVGELSTKAHRYENNKALINSAFSTKPRSNLVKLSSVTSHQAPAYEGSSVPRQADSEAAQLTAALYLPKKGQNTHWLFVGPMFGFVVWVFWLFGVFFKRKKGVKTDFAGQSNCLIPGNYPALSGWPLVAEKLFTTGWYKDHNQVTSEPGPTQVGFITAVLSSSCPTVRIVRTVFKACYSRGKSSCPWRHDTGRSSRWAQGKV